jgi:micrococcal nuclease
MVVRIRRRAARSRFTVAVCVVALAGLGIEAVGPLAGATTHATITIAATRSFGSCHTGGGTNCVVDGDTIWLDGEKIRISDIDAPETHPSRCAEEARLGHAATTRLQVLLNAGPVELASADRDTDRYGRKLRIVTQHGRSVGAVLVDEGLARPWEGRRRPWCDASA